MSKPTAVFAYTPSKNVRSSPARPESGRTGKIQQTTSNLPPASPRKLKIETEIQSSVSSNGGRNASVKLKIESSPKIAPSSRTTRPSPRKNTILNDNIKDGKSQTPNAKTNGQTSVNSRNMTNSKNGIQELNPSKSTAAPNINVKSMRSCFEPKENRLVSNRPPPSPSPSRPRTRQVEHPVTPRSNNVRSCLSARSKYNSPSTVRPPSAGNTPVPKQQAKLRRSASAGSLLKSEVYGERGSNLKRASSQTLTPTKPRVKFQDEATPECFSPVLLEAKGEHGSRESLSGEVTNLTVGVRVRPLFPGERSVVMVEGNTVKAKVLGMEHTFTYENCFQSSASQADLFTTMVRPLVDVAFQGYNVCLFAYGQTGTGKTYSMMGEEVSSPSSWVIAETAGIIPRFCQELFKIIEGSEEYSHTKVELSYFEIYNEKIHDLLGPSQSGRSAPLRVREHPELGPYVVDLTVHNVHSFEILMEWVKVGNSHRETAATEMNMNSSRSHSIFTLTLTQSQAEDRPSLCSKINLIDLAGSERLTHTCATGDRLKEGVSINRSLLTLGKVISSLAENKKRGFIPYRESVLTWLLRESLGGNSRTAMLATISPSHSCVEETLSTLRYACQARNIVNTVRINESPHEKRIRELNEEIQRLKEGLDFKDHEDCLRKQKSLQFQLSQATEELTQANLLRMESEAEVKRLKKELSDTNCHEACERQVVQLQNDLIETSDWITNYEGLIKKLKSEINDLKKTSQNDSKFSSLEKQVETLKEETPSYQKHTDQLENEINYLEKENQRYQKHIDQLEEENKDYQKTIKQSEKEINYLEEKNQRYQKHIDQLEEEHKDYQKTIKQSEKEINNLEEENQSYQKHIDRLEKENEDYQKTVKQSGKEINNLEEENQSYQKHIDRLEKENEDYQKTVKQSGKEINNLSEENQSYQKHIDQLVKENEDYQNTINQLGKEINKLEEELVQMKDTNVKYEMDFNEMKDLMNEIKYNNNHDSCDSQILMLQTALSEAERSLNNYKEKVKSLEKKTNEVNKVSNHDGCEKEIVALKCTISELKTSCDHDKCEGVIEKLKIALEEAENLVNELENENEQLRKTNASLQHDKEQLQKESISKRKSVDTAKSQNLHLECEDRIETLRRALSVSKSRNVHMECEKKISDLQSEIESLQLVTVADHTRCEERANNLFYAIEKYAEENSQLLETQKTEVEQYKETIRNLEEQISKLTALGKKSRRSLCPEVNQLEAQVRILKDENSRIKKKRVDDESKVTSLEEQVISLTKELLDVKSQLRTTVREKESCSSLCSQLQEQLSQQDRKLEVTKSRRQLVEEDKENWETPSKVIRRSIARHSNTVKPFDRCSLVMKAEEIHQAVKDAEDICTRLKIPWVFHIEPEVTTHSWFDVNLRVWDQRTMSSVRWPREVFLNWLQEMKEEIMTKSGGQKLFQCASWLKRTKGEPDSPSDSSKVNKKCNLQEDEISGLQNQISTLERLCESKKHEDTGHILNIISDLKKSISKLRSKSALSPLKCSSNSRR